MMGWIRVGLRLPLILLVLFGGLALLLTLRLVERPLRGQHRPWTPFITQIVCRICLVILGVKRHQQGHLMAQPGAVVANHSSWLDILVLNASARIYFVSKAEVAHWPGIGWLARATGTLFVRRRRQDAGTQAQRFETRLRDGHRLLFFPEGTSTDGTLVLPFKSTLFSPFFQDKLYQSLWVQPVSVHYNAPVGQDRRFYGWWGDMDFGGHALRVLAAPSGAVDLIYHRPLQVADFTDRKALAKVCETAVRSGISMGSRPNP